MNAIIRCNRFSETLDTWCAHRSRTEAVVLVRQPRDLNSTERAMVWMREGSY